MIGIVLEETDAASNLAAEEYLLDRAEDFCFLVYRNAPSIVVGRNQNALAEVDVLFTHTSAIPVLRRISGGGAVYHDLGNVNYAFIEPERETGRRSFEDFLGPVVAFLRSLGIPAQQDGRSDLGIGGLKVSGNAQCRRRGKILHHGTLLFDADLSLLERALRPRCTLYADKAVASIRRPVTNIRPFVKGDMNPEEFMERLFGSMQALFGLRRVGFTEADREAIVARAQEKYRSWEWNFGSSPPYRLVREEQTPQGTVRVSLDVVRGRVEKAFLDGTAGNGHFLERLEKALEGMPHHPLPISRLLEEMPDSSEISRPVLRSFLELLF